MTDCEKAAVPDCAPKVEVAMTVASVGLVPYAKPDSVASSPPVAAMAPLRAAVEVDIAEAEDVVSVGATTVTAILRSAVENSILPSEKLSPALTVNEPVPTAVGVPEMTPVEELSDNPDGSDPLETLKLLELPCV